MTGSLEAAGFPESSVRERAANGARAAFPPQDSYGSTVYGARPSAEDPIDALRLVPPVFTPLRLAKLIDLGREPTYQDVELDTEIGGFRSPLPVYVSAFGSTRVSSGDLEPAVTGQAGRLGIPMVIGENIMRVNGYGQALLARIRRYADAVPDGLGGVVVQQSTEDADAEVWNLVYSDPSLSPLLTSGRLAFELKAGQGAKPGLGGMTVLPDDQASKIAAQYTLEQLYDDHLLRSSSPGTFTTEILRQQIHFMRNNFPRARCWVKLPPTRDVALAAETAWAAGADSVTVDGAEGGTGWAPTAFLDHVGLPLGECLRLVKAGDNCLLATGRIWEGARAVKCLALGARAVGLGRAALIAADTGPDGLVQLVESLAAEARMLISALGKYRVADVSTEDIWPG
jgi:methylamine---glutamate N-methyltransferase subunit C